MKVLPGRSSNLNEEEQLKATALESLMHADPARAVPLADKLLQNQSASLGLRMKALSTLQMAQTPESRNLLVAAAKGERGADLQVRALQYVAVHGNAENRQVLADVYKSATDPALKKQVLRGWMASNDREQVLAAAKSEQNPELRGEAIQILGAMKADANLAELYAAESNGQVKERILRAFIASGNSDRLISLAQNEKDPELRGQAIRYLGSMRNPAAKAALVSMYDSTSDARSRASILRALAMSGDAKQLIDVARKEKDPQLKREAVQHLAHMHTQEATDFLMEVLGK